MELTEQQQRALDNARQMLAEDKQAAQSFGGLSDGEWRRALRLTLDDLVKALDAD